MKALGLVRDTIETEWFTLTVGILFSGISAYLSIYYFLAFIKRVGM